MLQFIIFSLPSIFANFLAQNLVLESITSWVGSEWVTKHDMAMEKEQICWFFQSLWVFRKLNYLQILCKSI